ncbi:MAG: acetoacetate--CoA ligase, partial [Gammaproteobacteria bacterium]|nr:acetoacetate--CoA ligase [Gammaproteobacteria bacterium]
AFLAVVSIGAVWSVCAPDMGTNAVLDRFRQIEPVALIACDGVTYGLKDFDRLSVVAELRAALPTVRHVILHTNLAEDPAAVDRALEAAQPCTAFSTATARYDAATAAFEPLWLPFDHPLWIVYSSGTTGLPKPIVHGHGGTVIVAMALKIIHNDVGCSYAPNSWGERYHWYSSTGWVMWNAQTSGLLNGTTCVLYDGNPAWPDAAALWRFIDEQKVTLFGCGAAYLINCRKDGLRPRDIAPLQSLRAINATGSPLPIDAYHWVYDAVKSDLWLASISGGTDIASGFVACAPILPVTAGEIQCRELGVAAYAFNDKGEPVIDEVGELVITKPMPSMPIFFWGDPEHRRYLESYFEMYPGLWRHGDWIRFTERGTSVIYGRSDSTINRYGIRMGTAEIYRVVEELPEIRDSLVIDLEYLGRPSFMPLFVVLEPGQSLDDALKARIVQQIKTKASARHVPNQIYQVDEIPRTLTGKKMEVPVRKLLLGAEAEKVASPDAMANPKSISFFQRLANELKASQTT